MPGSAGWVYRPGRGIWRLPAGAEEWAEVLAWCPEVADAVRYVSQDRRTITRAFKITVAGQTEIVAADDLTHGKAWPKYATAAGFTGRPISDVLVNIVTDQASRVADVIGTPHFAGGKLRLPPTEYLPVGYCNGEGSTLAALTALVSAVAPYSLAALLMGLSAAAPWIGPLRLQPFTVHLVGESTKPGKTTGETAAGALWGRSYKGITKIWHGTALGALGAFRDLGVLPVFRDELSTLKATPAERSTMFSTIMEGACRSARTRDDLARPSASWASACFSTGNISAVPASAASSGTPKGVIELHVDGERVVIPPDVKLRVQALTNDPEVYGSWVPFAKQTTVDEWVTAVEVAGKTLGDPAADGLGWHMWRAMSLALAGARKLAELTGVPELAVNAELAAREVIADTADRLAEIGADHGARLVETVAEFLSIRPAAFGLADPRDNAHTDQIGFMVTAQDGTELVCVYPSKHAEIVRAADVEDVSAALCQLRESGHLVTSKDKGFKYQTRHAPKPVYAYNLSVETDRNDRNNRNTAGQGPNFCSGLGTVRLEQRPEHGAETGSEQDSGQCPGCGTLPPLHASDCPDLPPLPPEPGPELDEYQDQEPDAEAQIGNGITDLEVPAGSPFTALVRAYLADCSAAPVPLDRRYHPTADGALKSIVHRGRAEADAIRAAFADLTGHATETATAAPEVAAPELTDPAPANDAATAPGAAESLSEPTEGGPAEPARRKVADLSGADELATFTRALRKGEQYPDATDADLAAALGIFHAVTDGGRFVSFAGQTGQALFARLLARFPSMVPPEPVTSDKAREVWASGVQTTINYVTKGHEFRVGQQFTGYDVNGQFPAAAGSAVLGDGQPVTIDRPRSLDGLVERPGYVRTARAVRTGHPAFGTIAAGTWLPMPFVKFITVDLRVTVPAAEVLYWPKGGQRLSAYVQHTYRVPRERLAEMPDSLPVTYAMAALKDQANSFIGMLRSEKWSAKGIYYRPDWHDMILATAGVNVLRAFAKCDVPPVAKMADCAYWIADTAPYVPAGLVICERGRHVGCKHAKAGQATGAPQLGKWKLERFGRVTDAFTESYRAGQPGNVQEAAKAADAGRRTA